MSGGVGGEPVVQGLPLVLDERVLLDHHSLEAGEGMNDACIWDLCTDLEERWVCFWYLQRNQQLVKMCHTVLDLLEKHSIK